MRVATARECGSWQIPCARTACMQLSGRATAGVQCAAWGAAPCCDRAGIGCLELKELTLTMRLCSEPLFLVGCKKRGAVTEHADPVGGVGRWQEEA